MKNGTKVLALFLVMLFLPAVGFGQNAPQKEARVDSVTQVMKAAQEQEVVPVRPVSAIVGDDTILSVIQDTLSKISTRTLPKNFLFWDDSSKVASWIAFLALIAGLGAAIYARKGYVYQKKSAQSLERMENNRLPFMSFARKIFENILTLDILSDIETDVYVGGKDFRREGYQVDKAIDGLKMPDDLIDLRCYERFSDDSIYISAINLKVSWRNYNKTVDDLTGLYERKEYDKLVLSYQKLRRKTVALLQEFCDFEDLITGRPIKRFSFARCLFSSRAFYKVYTEWNTQCGVSNKPVGSRMRFLSQLLLDSYKGTEQCKLRENRDFILRDWSAERLNEAETENIPWVADSAIFKHDANILGIGPNIPMNEYAEKMLLMKARKYKDRSWKYWERLSKSTLFLQSQFHGWPQSTIDLYKLIYDKVGNIERPTRMVCLWNYFFESVWNRYFDNMINRRDDDNYALLCLMYNQELGLRRRAMLEGAQSFRRESLYYAEEFRRYDHLLVSPLYFDSDKHRHFVFRDLICAVVAEQCVSFNVDDLLVAYGTDEGFRFHTDVKDFVPVLTAMGVIRGGKVVVRTSEEIETLLQKYHGEKFVDEELDDRYMSKWLNSRILRLNRKNRQEKRMERKMAKRHLKKPYHQ